MSDQPEIRVVSFEEEDPTGDTWCSQGRMWAVDIKGEAAHSGFGNVGLAYSPKQKNAYKIAEKRLLELAAQCNRLAKHTD